MPSSQQIFGFLQDASRFSQQAAGFVDDARRREAQVIVNDLTPKIRASLYGGFDTLKSDPSLDPEEWDKLWQQGTLDDGRALFDQDWEGVIETQKNPYVREALQKELVDTKWQIGQHITENRQAFVNSRAVGTASSSIAAYLDEDHSPEETAAFVTGQMEAIRPIMDPADWMKTMDSYRSVIAIDALTTRGQAVVEAALASENPLEGIPLLEAELNKVGSFNLGGQVITIDPGARSKVKSALTNDLQERYAINSELRSAALKSLTGSIRTDAVDPSWHNAAGLISILRALKGQEAPGLGKKTIAEIADLRSRKGASALMEEVSNRIDYLQGKQAAESLSDAEKSRWADDYMTSLVNRWMTSVDLAPKAILDELDGYINDVASSPDARYLSRAANNIKGDVRKLFDLKLDNGSDSSYYRNGLAILATALAKKPAEQRKTALDYYLGGLAKGRDGTQLHGMDIEAFARKVAAPSLVDTLDEYWEAINSGTLSSFGGDSGWSGWVGTMTGAKGQLELLQGFDSRYATGVSLLLEQKGIKGKITPAERDDGRPRFSVGGKEFWVERSGGKDVLYTTQVEKKGNEQVTKTVPVGEVTPLASQGDATRKAAQDAAAAPGPVERRAEAAAAVAAKAGEDVEKLGLDPVVAFIAKVGQVGTTGLASEFGYGPAGLQRLEDQVEALLGATKKEYRDELQRKMAIIRQSWPQKAPTPAVPKKK